MVNKVHVNKIFNSVGSLELSRDANLMWFIRDSLSHARLVKNLSPIERTAIRVTREHGLCPACF